MVRTWIFIVASAVVALACSSTGSPTLANQEEQTSSEGSGGTDAGSTGEEASGADGGTSATVSSICSLEENAVRTAQAEADLLDPEGYGPTPEECIPDLDGTYTAPETIERDTDKQKTIEAAFKDGVLLAIDESLCEPVRPGETPDYSPCAQEYVCGCCPWTLNNNSGMGWVVRAASGNDCGTADRYSLDGYVIEPGAANADNPVSAAPETDSPCDICLNSCRGLSSCCTGTGCLCEAECMPLPGTCSQNFCCNAFGCLCRSCPCDESWCP